MSLCGSNWNLPETLESDAILSISNVTVPQVDYLSLDIPDAPIDATMEPHGPLPKVRCV